jgi:Fe-S oxidoreductase
MTEHRNNPQTRIDFNAIRAMLKEKGELLISFSQCMACGLCAESCFIYRNSRDPMAAPSYKAINSYGVFVKKKGRVSLPDMHAMTKLLWGKCVLCGRCRCPLGVSIPSILAWARSICRSQGVCEDYASAPRGAEP